MFDRIVRLSIGNPVFVHLLFVLVIAAGLRSAARLPREEFPEISLDRVLVTVLLPGATAEDVEELVTRPIEDALADVSNIDTFTSNTSEGHSNLVITFLDGTDLQDARAEVERAVSSVEDLPDDAETPVVKEMILELPVISVALIGDPSATLVVDRLADDLRNLPGVATVNVSGLGTREIAVHLDERKLRTLGIQPDRVVGAIRSAQANVPAGTVEDAGQDIFVKTRKTLTSAADVARIPIQPGSPLRISDVASVTERVDPADTLFWVNGEPAVKLMVGREETADPIEIREAVIEALPELQRRVPEDHRLEIAEDFTYSIRDRLDTVIVNAVSGALLVMLVLFVMSGFRQAMLAIVGMPVSFLAATWLMDGTGMSINVVSTFGLLIATGIIVDDAIVVIENVQRHLEMGKSRAQAVLDGTREVLVPVMVAVLTTVLAFIPLTMVGGTMGRVMRILPLAVIFCLLGSLFETIFLLPGHLNDYASRDAKESRTARLNEAMQRVYRPMLAWCLRHRWLTLGLVLVAFAGTGAIAAKMPFQLGAPAKPFQLAVHYELSPGLTRAATKAQGDAIDARLRELLGDDKVKVTTLRVGSILDEETDVLSTGANLGHLRWELAYDEVLATRYPAAVRQLRLELATNPDLARSAVKEMQAGPPTGASVTARIRGRDPADIDRAMDEVKEVLYGWEATSDIRDNYGSGKETFRVDVDQDRAALYGLTEREVALAVRTAVDGVVAAEVSIDEEPVDIVVRYADGQTRARSGLRDLVIANAQGKAIRLDQVARVERTRDLGFVRREDGLRTGVVYADTDRDVLPPLQAAARLQDTWDRELAGRHPDLTLEFGGEADELSDSLNDLPGAFMLALLLIYIVLALQFRSYVQPLIILAAVPFGLMGAILGLFVMGYDLSLLALFGIVALAGIVVNDSLVMIDFVNSRRREGEPPHVAVLEGAVGRLRAILATTLTTCLGLFPLAIGLGGRDEVLAPMAVSIAAGLGFATVLVLLVVPPLYLVLEDLRTLPRRLFRGRVERPTDPGGSITAVSKAIAPDDPTPSDP
jgi:multidrug efflux pump subunit AcrB